MSCFYYIICDVTPVQQGVEREHVTNMRSV